MNAGVLKRRAGCLALFAAVADWSTPGGFLNRFFHAHHWFPTNLTSLFAERLAAPETAPAILLVSASAPLFWTLLALTAAALVAARRRGTAFRLFAALLVALFALTQVLMPWWGENDPLSKVPGFFPIVSRGNGRAYELAYLYASPLFLALFFLSRRSRPTR